MTVDRLLMTRRKLIQSLFLFFLLITGYMVFFERSKWLKKVASRLLKPQLDSSAQTGKLSQTEMETLVACAEVLVKGKTLTTSEREYLIDHIDYRSQNTRGYYPLYRMTTKLLDRLAKAQFSTLKQHDRTALMVRHRLTSHDIRKWEYFLPFNQLELAARLYVVPDLIVGYYQSPAGWAVVGYKTFPGRCSNLIRYTLPEV